LSQEASYDVYVNSGGDPLARDEFRPAVAHFVERGNAVALKRRLEARGQKVHVERSTVYDLSEAEKEAWFSDYTLAYRNLSLHMGSGPARDPSALSEGFRRPVSGQLQ
jgi:hypothetical protein